MAIASTNAFNPDIGELIEEAFELCGLEAVTGNDLRTARRSINYLTLEWANEGINLWMIEEVVSSALAADTATIDIPIDTISILDAVIRTDDADTSLQSDIVINRISSTTYAQIPSKLDTGRPVQWYYARKGVQDDAAGTDQEGTVTFWPVPDVGSTYKFVYWAIKRIGDTGGTISNTMEIPDRFLPSFVYGLAYRIAVKKAPQRVPGLKLEYRELFEKAMEEDRFKEDFRITPDLTPYQY